MMCECGIHETFPTPSIVYPITVLYSKVHIHNAYSLPYYRVVISGSTMEQATTDVIDVQIPHIGSLMQSGELVVDSIDVFCEKGVFDLDSTRQILLAGKAINLPANFHGEELHHMKTAEVCYKREQLLDTSMQ